jgi:hypothetical protein
LGIAAVDAGVSPFGGQSAVESFDAFRWSGSVWPGAAVLNVAERFGEKLRFLTRTVGGQHFPNGDSTLGKPTAAGQGLGGRS